VSHPGAREVAWVALVSASCQLNWTPVEYEKKARTLQPAGTASASMATANDVNKEARCAPSRGHIVSRNV